MQAEHSNSKTSVWATNNSFLPCQWMFRASGWHTSHSLLPILLPMFLPFVCISGRFPAAFRDQCRAEGSNAGCQHDADQQRTPEITNATLCNCKYHSAARPFPLTHVEHHVRCVFTWQKRTVCLIKPFVRAERAEGVMTTVWFISCTSGWMYL